MDAAAVILEAPERVALRPLPMIALHDGDVLVQTAWTGVSTGTEKLFWTGRMPPFPGMGYPLVPGYESVGRVIDAGAAARGRIGDWVFVPGANCWEGARGLFGGTAARLATSADRAVIVPEALGSDGVLVALAATAHHAVAGALPDLIVGHGVLGRLAARLTLALGGAAPTVWDIDPARRDGADGYIVVDPLLDERRDYARILDVSGDGAGLDLLVARLARGGEIVLAGFYERPLCFAFPPAFQREARIRVAAQWARADLDATVALIAAGALRLGGLVSHERPAAEAEDAYPAAFADRECLKMVLNWSAMQ